MRGIRAAVVVVALLAAVSPHGARGQDEAAESALMARELFALLFDNAVVHMNAQAVEYAWPAIEDALRAKEPRLDGAALAELRQEFQRIRLDLLRDMMKDAPTIYSRVLRRDEMRDLIAFYRTPSGQKMLQVVPQVFTELFATVVPRLPALAMETQEVFLKRVRERGLLR